MSDIKSSLTKYGYRALYKKLFKKSEFKKARFIENHFKITEET